MEEEVPIISKEEYEQSKDYFQEKRWLTQQQKYSFTQLTDFINTKDFSYLEPFQQEEDDAYQSYQRESQVTHFGILDNFYTDDSNQSTQNEIHAMPETNLKRQFTSRDAIRNSSNNNIKQSTSQVEKEQKQKKTEQIKSNIQSEPQVQAKVYKTKKLLRIKMQELEMEADQGLTYYQRKKNFILKMKEDQLLLDWDSLKKDDLIYEQNSVGGASRWKKNSKKIDIIDLPHPSQSVSNSYSKEAKSYRKQPRSSRLENKIQLKRQIQDDEEDQNSNYQNHVVKEQTKQINNNNRIDKYLPYQKIELISVEKKELLKRKEEFIHNNFLREKYVDTRYNYISSKAQAIIPQIRPLDEVRNTWVLKDLDQILTYKNSQQYMMLEDYMNKFFGARTPQQVFNILKINQNNLKNAINYVNVNNDFLQSYYINQEYLEKKKLQKRKFEKKKNQ